MPLVFGVDASRALSTIPTGTEGYSYHLIHALATLASQCCWFKDARVRLYFREGPTSYSETWRSLPPSIEMRILHFPRLWTHIRLSWEMICYPPDLLFVPAHVIPLVHPHRTLVTIHDLGYRYFPDAHPWQQRYYLDISTRWNARKATHILADSQATREAIVEEYNIPSEKITVVYPGYNSTLQPVRDSVVLQTTQRRYGISTPYILYLGRIQPRKNLVRLVGAFAQLASSHPNLSLVLAGPSGWLAAPIHARVQNLGLAHRVHFPGYIAEADKAALLSGARVFAFPSLYEGFGFPVLEAQACGVPVLTSNTTSLPEVAGDGALFVDPHDENAIAAGLSELLESTSLRQDVIQYGTENLARFSWEKTAHTVAELMKALVNECSDHATS